ncbi:hypothetical protein VTN00DRAFT_725 [Thermoascus crustaceus]|uniref:uncharacterized protein n=1 Tax=Thermoascus crustaceus TaxID=5088 RepID=UPI003742D21A
MPRRRPGLARSRLLVSCQDWLVLSILGATFDALSLIEPDAKPTIARLRHRLRAMRAIYSRRRDGRRRHRTTLAGWEQGKVPGSLQSRCVRLDRFGAGHTRLWAGSDGLARRSDWGRPGATERLTTSPLQLAWKSGLGRPSASRVKKRVKTLVTPAALRRSPSDSSLLPRVLLP